METLITLMMLVQLAMAANDGSIVAAPEVVHQETDTGR
jgi:hypothetical protein